MSEPIVHQFSLAQLVEKARTLAVPGERHILGITGAPGTGKSTVAALVVEALGPDLATLVPMDGFHLSNAVLEDLGRRGHKGAHDTFDDFGYAVLLRLLRHQIGTPRSHTGLPIYAPEFRRDLEESVGSAIPISAATPLIVTEGNYLLLERNSWPDARQMMDEVWFLDLADETRRERLILRHETVGKTHAEAELWAWGSDQRNAALIESTRDRADFVVRLV
ncbi:nucleoside/nucleotide kinase family protein [Cryobacterium psychrophilum]|uniref:nucleoside/nucleotide kinase family protein n=1 Tax=Cryobacterium psychrophilum TaxID=41988 RepID=UPI0010D5F56B|nr:nucleoside/nucleotide kinase family protein [Cryobacterium psychrophilum]TDW28697.1 pantothenate kinase [Cryobacterium psychrophilum]